MDLEMVGKFVLLKELKRDETKIHIPGEQALFTKIWEILKVGPGTTDEEKAIAASLKAGDHVIIPMGAPREAVIEKLNQEDKIWITRLDAIYAKVKDNK